MAKTNRIKNKNNVTHKKKLNKINNCSIGLKPFEEKFSKTIPLKQLKVSNKKKKREFVKELLTKFAPNSIKPNNDFYDYINYQWLKNVSLEKQQEYIVQIDDFRLAQDKVYHELDEIILQYIKTHNDKLSKNLKNYYTSVINLNPKSYTRQLAKESVQLVEDFLAGHSPWEILAYINKDEMLATDAPFVWSLNPYYKNNKQYRCNLDSHQFTLLDISVYYDDGTNVEYKKKYRENFKKYNKKLFNTLLGPNNYNMEDVFDVEVEMFNALSCTTITSKEENTSSTVYSDEALTKYSFDWKTFSKALGFKTPPDFFVVSSLNYLKCCSELLVSKWNTDKWKTYWIWIFLKRLARITKDWEELNYSFFGEFERGQGNPSLDILIKLSDVLGMELKLEVKKN
jgi:putative endopeptidase